MVHFDPALAADAHKAKALSTEFIAKFNRHKGNAEWEVWDVALEVEAKVITLSDGNVVGRLGMLASRQLHLGPSTLLKIGEYKGGYHFGSGANSRPSIFEMFGEDIATAQSVIVKSGSFWGRICSWFSDAQTVEVDTGRFDFACS